MKIRGKLLALGREKKNHMQSGLTEGILLSIPAMYERECECNIGSTP